MRPERRKLQHDLRGVDAASPGITRRHAMGRMAMTASSVLCATALVPGELAASTSRFNDASSFELEDWKSLIGSQFLVTDWQHSVTRLPIPVAKLKLEKVIEHSWVADKDPNRPAGLRAAPISLLFSARVDIPSATYHFESAKMRKSQLFVHATGYTGHGRKKMFEVVLN